jgi:hypothetical protein
MASYTIKITATVSAHCEITVDLPEGIGPGIPCAQIKSILENEQPLEYNGKRLQFSPSDPIYEVTYAPAL